MMVNTGLNKKYQFRRTKKQGKCRRTRRAYFRESGTNLRALPAGRNWDFG